MAMHELKTWPAPFHFVRSGAKRFEWRKNDRDYQRGDVLWLREYEPASGRYSGAELWASVTYVLREGFGVPEGYCVMSIDVLPNEPERTEDDGAGGGR